MLADKCLEHLGENEPAFSDRVAEVIHARAKAVKGLVEFVHGRFHSGTYLWRLPRPCLIVCDFLSNNFSYALLNVGWFFAAQSFLKGPEENKGFIGKDQIMEHCRRCYSASYY